MISSLDGESFEPVVTYDLDHVLSFQDEHLIPPIDDSGPIIVHALKSTQHAVQGPFFTTAFELIALHVPNIFKRMVFKELFNKEIRDKEILPEGVVNWLLSSHLHLIYTHVHQGNIAT